MVSFRDPVFDDAPISSDDPNGSMSDPVILPARIVLADFKTRYHGYYSQDFRTAYLTHTTGDGTPYIMFFEFGEFSLGKEVQVKQNTGIFDFQSKTFTVKKLYTGETLWNLDDTKVTNHNGIELRGTIPSLSYDSD